MPKGSNIFAKLDQRGMFYSFFHFPNGTSAVIMYHIQLYDIGTSLSSIHSAAHHVCFLVLTHTMQYIQGRDVILSTFNLGSRGDIWFSKYFFAGISLTIFFFLSFIAILTFINIGRCVGERAWDIWITALHVGALLNQPTAYIIFNTSVLWNKVYDNK